MSFPSGELSSSCSWCFMADPFLTHRPLALGCHLRAMGLGKQAEGEERSGLRILNLSSIWIKSSLHHRIYHLAIRAAAGLIPEPGNFLSGVCTFSPCLRGLSRSDLASQLESMMCTSGSLRIPGVTHLTVWNGGQSFHFHEGGQHLHMIKKLLSTSWL